VITFIVIIAVLVIFLSIVLCIGNGMYSTYAQENKLPIVVENNKNFAIEPVFTGINGGSTNMAFLGPNDILVLQKNSGKVNRILNGSMLDEPLIDVNSFYQDGLIGIATTKSQNGLIYVFLYYNEAPLKYGADVDDWKEAKKVNQILGYDQEGERLYRYNLVGNKLVEPKLLFEIRAPQPSNNLGVMHHGGEVLIGPDSAVYVGTGDLEGKKYGVKTKAQNYKDDNDEPDGRAGILRVTQDGKLVGKGILGNTYPLNLYYAYGIRNSFGMDFDPVTGNMWITENGPNYGDEINLAEPGFNSGADILYGMSTEYDKLQNLVNFEGKGKYSEPEFVWTHTVCPTALKFFNSDKFGKEYENDMFVADFSKGNIYHFDLNEKRTELILPGPLKDKVADKPAEIKDIIFAKGFGKITDLQVGPDGYLYVLSYGKIFRIIPKN
jgi:glucose/arabinose dehydrogenase